MLQNGLGKLLRAESSSAGRIVDLFCGAGSVCWFAAQNIGKPVIAYDLQTYAAILAGAVVERTTALNASTLYKEWLDAAKEARCKSKAWKQAIKLDHGAINTATWRKHAQRLCTLEASVSTTLVWTKYGGYYFSPSQALAFDAMIGTLPTKSHSRNACLAALIIAASRCAASPGHTAQPFKATRTASRYLREAWKRDPFDYAEQALNKLCPLHAIRRGKAAVADANDVANTLKEGDLVFLDPPYSGVHYSRFYHVLETIARGHCGAVEGIGRYPPSWERPHSAYSRRESSHKAMEDLLTTLANRGCRVVLTFPKEECSNGLSGKSIENMARKHYRVTRRVIKSRFSTLGGNMTNRAARKLSDELILVLRSK